MSNLLYMDETNCNGVYASKANSLTAALTPASNGIISNGNGNGNGNDNINSNSNSNNILLAGNISISNSNNSNNISTANIISNNTNTNNINNINIMNVAASTVTMATAVGNTNVNVNVNAVGPGIVSAATLPTSVSNEDLSQSLSEYTDADESISAPTEFLAEFLSAVMLKDYKKALKYCKLILQYEPNNATAKEFYPLIIEKLRGTAASDSDENYNKSSSPDPVLELQSSDPSAGESDEAAFEDQPIDNMEGGIDVYGLAEDNCNSLGDSNSHELNVSSRSDSIDSAGDSLSESVDDEGEEEDVDDEDVVEIDDDDDDDDDDDEEDEVDDDDDEDDEEDVISSSGDDLPIDDPNSIGAAAGTGNNSLSSRNSSSGGGGGGGRSRSDNTTHSYSSLLLEEEDDIAPVNLKFTKELSSPDLDVSNGNKLPSTSCSDSESPTEPLTQRLAAILRSKCGVSSTDDKY
ncbi:probable serine/threonine-protein kinase DDB_G0267686 [Rhagoletis pomonella]|uniref:probable serine/threonine-protein kinase DDB_G0267686 n=1 Tax=Rhagoletis pomonella TaxID=28610 RepID=UPI00177EDCB1|nr:probable serine/threonine-protein kinase DDB_G0267686 [Rhagoletis pomonella]